MSWDDEYGKNQRLWGEQPSELAVAAVAYLQKHRQTDRTIEVLDIGCGYGRDAFYLMENVKCKILGIDTSERAIDIALNTDRATQKERPAFRRCNFMELREGDYDVVFVSNLYQLLRTEERKELRNAISRTLRPGGLLFLSTLSVHDPEHFGKGSPIPGEPNSFEDGRYLHLCMRQELLDDFSFLKVADLYEHEYYEPRATGETHHHISWILRAKGR